VILDSEKNVKTYAVFTARMLSAVGLCRRRVSVCVCPETFYCFDYSVKMWTHFYRATL